MQHFNIIVLSYFWKVGSSCYSTMHWLCITWSRKTRSSLLEEMLGIAIPSAIGLERLFLWFVEFYAWKIKVADGSWTFQVVSSSPNMYFQTMAFIVKLCTHSLMAIRLLSYICFLRVVLYWPHVQVISVIYWCKLFSLPFFLFWLYKTSLCLHALRKGPPVGTKSWLALSSLITHPECAAYRSI